MRGNRKMIYAEDRFLIVTYGLGFVLIGLVLIFD